MITMSPTNLDFGCVAQGFIYNLDVLITNSGTKPQRIKVTCVKRKGSDVNNVTASSISQQFASGMTAAVKIELRAETSAGSSLYEVIITAEHDQAEIRAMVTSLIIPMEIFKYFAKSLILQKRPVIKNGVSVTGITTVGNIAAAGAVSGTLDEKSLFSDKGTAVSNSTTGQSIFLEYLMDDQDIEDILEIPMAYNMYWDPTSKMAN
mmetsp:Transcript_8092/g.8116  ORF Transcript_8092/g.8116 Transcript_8092/m.8116 type:complete len:206 (+) Transcript_8092:145-762(+)